jgi:GT2 family glycosyltransferase
MEKVNSTDLSIIILSYKSKEHLKVLLPSIYQSSKKYSFEAIVVDNDSRDGSAEAVEKLLPSLPNLKLIKNVNNGFSAGNNIGIEQASGKYILLLNPDTKVEPNTFEVMLDFMESRSDVGISGCKVIKADGTLDLACRRRFPNPWNATLRFMRISNKNYNMLDTDENQSQEVDSVMGAFLLIRKSLIEKIGLLDKSFFMYGEDLDWCWRCKQAGKKVWYYPKTFITHYKGSSSGQTPFKALRWFHDAMWTFYKKHYFAKYPAAFGYLVFLGIYFRLGLLVFVNLFKSKPGVSS